MVVSTIRAYAVTFAVLLMLAGCGGEPNQKSVTFNPNIDVFSGEPDGGGSSTSARTLTCTKEINGQCMQKTCKQSSENVPEVPFNCASYAAACVNAGEHWSGTKEGGTCTRVL
jgi:hypothetical protein